VPTKKKILFADDPDQDDALKVYRVFFEDQGYEVLTAKSDAIKNC